MLVVATAAVVSWLRTQDTTTVVRLCAAELDGTSWFLTPEQADNAALLGATALRRGLPARATTIAIATALQESGLRNLEHGDRDSLGLFQQRPSQGWGTPEQVMDPVYATGAFYDALEQVDGYQDLPITEAAQAVQRSAFPEAYAQHEVRARAWASGLSGYSPAVITCALAAPGPGDPDVVRARVERDLGAPARASGATVVVQAAALPGGEAEPERLAWAVAQWAVAAARPLGVTEVHVTDQVWTRADDTWGPGAPVPDGVVMLVLPTAG